MSAITSAIFTRMSTDATLVALLGTFNAAPCIFMGSHVPAGAPRPYVISWPPVSDQPFDTKILRGRAVARDIAVYCDATASNATVETAAERIRTLFHRHALTVAGYGTIIASVSGPVEAPSDASLRGLLLTTSLTVMAT